MAQFVGPCCSQQRANKLWKIVEIELLFMNKNCGNLRFFMTLYRCNLFRILEEQSRSTKLDQYKKNKLKLTILAIICLLSIYYSPNWAKGKLNSLKSTKLLHCINICWHDTNFDCGHTRTICEHMYIDIYIFTFPQTGLVVCFAPLGGLQLNR